MILGTVISYNEINNCSVRCISSIRVSEAVLYDVCVCSVCTDDGLWWMMISCDLTTTAKYINVYTISNNLTASGLITYNCFCVPVARTVQIFDPMARQRRIITCCVPPALYHTNSVHRLYLHLYLLNTRYGVRLVSASCTCVVQLGTASLSRPMNQSYRRLKCASLTCDLHQPSTYL